jgi:hypothetical protein
MGYAKGLPGYRKKELWDAFSGFLSDIVIAQMRAPVRARIIIA